MSEEHSVDTQSEASVSTHKAVAVGSWRAAWHASPGPKYLRDMATLSAKGFFMGVADIIPGVSGGTIAFITGIYEQLLAAIASFDSVLVRFVLQRRFREALAHVHARFLVLLLGGIALALITMSHLMHWLLNTYPAPIWALFCGLIGASIIIVGKHVHHWGRAAPALIVGSVGAYLLVGLIPLETPQAWWFLLICGMIAICAMILPGISGSFLLLMLGKYEYVTGAVKSPASLESLSIIAIFGCGAVAGIVLFSRVLRWCLAHAHNVTMALLMGAMVGGMRKLWPWKEVIERRMVSGKERILRTANILPETFDSEVLVAILLGVLGFVAVLFLEHVSGNKEQADHEPECLRSGRNRDFGE